MARQIPFVKMQGLGNDYIYVNAIEYPLDNPSELARRWSDRRTGIGSDGLILIGSSDKADFSMRIFNADGSEGLMCGNGARCVGRYLREQGLSDKDVITLETLSGIKTLRLSTDASGIVRSVSVEMGKGGPMQVRLPSGGTGTFVMEAVEAALRRFTGTAVDVGNPHLVLLVDDAASAPVAEAGAELECNSMFPDRVNVEFVQVLDAGHLRMRVWERGSGITSACGTGACAAVVAASMAGLLDTGACVVKMDGGDLSVSWDPSSGLLEMSGPAETVFCGTVQVA